MSVNELRKQLMQAAADGDLKVLKAILDEHPDAVHLRNSHHNSALRSAVAHSQLEAAQVLVERGADVLQKNHGGSSLMEAAAYAGDRRMVEWLEKCGLAIGGCELCAVGNLSAMKALEAAKPNSIHDSDRRGLTPLHHAARNNHVAIVDWLVDSGADIHACNKHGHEPLAEAVEGAAIDGVVRLLSHGANPNASGGHYRGSVLHRAVLHKSYEIVDALLNAGADPNQRDAGGKTPLHEAIRLGNKTIVIRMLGDPRTDLSVRSNSTKFSAQGETPSEYAENRKKKGIATLLEGVSGG